MCIRDRGEGPKEGKRGEKVIRVEDGSIVVKDLTKIFQGGFAAVDHVSFEIKDGELFGLLGPKGVTKAYGR